uniref:Uncharacterized protein n=1 Tax=Oryza barthii TaxID=65489 RepID=A0A0D3F669_9ORYZ
METVSTLWLQAQLTVYASPCSSYYCNKSRAPGLSMTLLLLRMHNASGNQLFYIYYSSSNFNAQLGRKM